MSVLNNQPPLERGDDPLAELSLWLTILQTAALLVLELVLIALAGCVAYKLGIKKKGDK